MIFFRTAPLEEDIPLVMAGPRMQFFQMLSGPPLQFAPSYAVDRRTGSTKQSTSVTVRLPNGENLRPCAITPRADALASVFTFQSLQLEHVSLGIVTAQDTWSAMIYPLSVTMSTP